MLYVCLLLRRNSNNVTILWRGEVAEHRTGHFQRVGAESQNSWTWRIISLTRTVTSVYLATIREDTFGGNAVNKSFWGQHPRHSDERRASEKEPTIYALRNWNNEYSFSRCLCKRFQVGKGRYGMWRDIEKHSIS